MLKYTVEVNIKLPREKVVKLFADPQHFKDWQPQLQSFETLTGNQGQVGSKNRVVHKMGRRTVEMIETVTKRNLPAEMHGTYETKGVWNEVENSFQELGSAKTKWTCQQTFRFEGFFMKVIALLLPAAFKNQSKKLMTQFKDFAEHHKD